MASSRPTILSDVMVKNLDRMAIIAEMNDIQGSIQKKELEVLIKENPEAWLPVKKKLTSKSIRSSFAVWAYEFLLDTLPVVKPTNSRVFRSAIPFIIEVVITHAYLWNQVYDNKNRVNNLKKRQKNERIANTLQNELFNFVNNHQAVSELWKRQITSSIRGMITDIKNGQISDKAHGLSFFNKESFDTPFPSPLLQVPQLLDRVTEFETEIPEYKDSVKFYFNRCYLISASLFCHTVNLIADLLAIPLENSLRKRMLAFAEAYGIMMQVVNDISDFVFERPTLHKQGIDVMSDLKNKLVTLPILMHLHKAKEGIIYDFFLSGETKPLDGLHNLVLKEVIQTDAISRSLELGRFLSRLAMSFLNESPTESSLKLESLCHIAYENRYYYHCYKATRHYEKVGFEGTIYSCENHLSKIT